MLNRAHSPIQSQFSRAAITYDGAALVQKQACERLIDGLGNHVFSDKLRIVDAGCGTGWSATRLQERFPESQIYLIDFAPGMIQLARSSGQPACVGNIEALPFAAQTFDLWWSNMVVQWCHLPNVLQEATRVLKPGGVLACTTLLNGTFQELSAAFQTVDRYQHTLSFQTIAEVATAIEQAHLLSFKYLAQTYTLYYPDLKTLLRSIQAVGANKVLRGARTGMMSRKQWYTLEHAYEAQRTTEGLPLSYCLLFFYACAPGYIY